MQSTRVNTIVRISGTIYFTFLPFFFFFSLIHTRKRVFEDRCRLIHRGGSGGGLFDEIKVSSEILFVSRTFTFHGTWKLLEKRKYEEELFE